VTEEGKEREHVRRIITFCSKSLSTYKTTTFQNPEEHSLEDFQYEGSKIYKKKKCVWQEYMPES